jgi:hypothetical protein
MKVCYIRHDDSVFTLRSVMRGGTKLGRCDSSRVWSGFKRTALPSVLSCTLQSANDTQRSSKDLEREHNIIIIIIIIIII